MLRDGPIPRFVHGILEYAMGALFIAAPFLFEFNSSAATGMSVAVGVLILIFAAASEGPVSLVNQLPVLLHVTLLYLLSIFLIAAPFLLGFSDEVAPRNFFIISGVLLLLITIGTRFRRIDRRESTDRSSAAKSSATATPTASGASARPAAAAEPVRPTPPTTTTGPAVAAPSPAGRGVPPPSSYPPVPSVGPAGPPPTNQPPGYPPPGYPPQQPPSGPGQPPYGEQSGGQRPNPY